jgi:flagella synthesis protein FlgN
MSAWQEPLFNLIQAETSCALALLECLREEETCLQSLRPELLEQVIGRKVLLLKEMTQYAINRTELLDRHQLPSDPQGLNTLLRAQGEPVFGLWRELLGLASQLEQQNQVNGSIIQLSKQRSQMALDILTQPPDSGKTYGKQGYAQPDSTSYTSVKA